MAPEKPDIVGTKTGILVMWLSIYSPGSLAAKEESSSS